MAQKNKTDRKPAASSEAVKTKRRPVKKPVKAKVQKQGIRKSPQPRVWRRVAKLAGDGLVALDASNLVEVRGCLEAIRAVGLCAEES